MSKPVTPTELYDMWQKMVNPGAYPLQSLMFPMADAKEIEKKIAELETVEHWLKANLNMLQLSIKSLEYQKAMLKAMESLRKGAEGKKVAPEAVPDPATWAWNLMAQAVKAPAKDEAPEKALPRKAQPRRKKRQ
jgi:thiamine monophosphate synthase